MINIIKGEIKIFNTIYYIHCYDAYSKYNWEKGYYDKFTTKVCIKITNENKEICIHEQNSLDKPEFKLKDIIFYFKQAFKEYKRVLYIKKITAPKYNKHFSNLKIKI